MRSAFLLILACVFSPAAAHGEPPIQIGLTVRRGFQFNRLAPKLSQPTYEVTVLALNASDTDVAFSRVRVAFIPSNGNSLIIFNVREMPDRREENFVLKPGESEKLHVTSNGSTQDLIHDTKNESLQFRVELILENRIIAGPYVAKLPDLGTLREEVSVPLVLAGGNT